MRSQQQRTFWNVAGSSQRADLSPCLSDSLMTAVNFIAVAGGVLGASHTASRTGAQFGFREILGSGATTSYSEIIPGLVVDVESMCKVAL